MHLRFGDTRKTAVTSTPSLNYVAMFRQRFPAPVDDGDSRGYRACYRPLLRRLAAAGFTQVQPVFETEPVCRWFATPVPDLSGLSPRSRRNRVRLSRFQGVLGPIPRTLPAVVWLGCPAFLFDQGVPPHLAVLDRLLDVPVVSHARDDRVRRLSREQG